MKRLAKSTWGCGVAILGSWGLWFVTVLAGRLFDRLFARAYPNGLYGYIRHFGTASNLSMQPNILLVLAVVGTLCLLALERWYSNSETKMLIYVAYLTLWACLTVTVMALLLAPDL